MTLRALIVGLGAIGQRHARTLRAQLGPELVLSAVRSRRSPVVVSSQLTASEGDPAADCNGGIFSDLDDALDSRPDLVLICTPSSLHIPAAISAVEAGAAVFIEKPLSSTLVGVDSLRVAASRYEAVVTVGFQLRFHPALARLRQLIDTQAVGRLLRVDAEVGEYLPSFHPYEDYRQSYAARNDLGGGVVLTQIHELDYLDWIFGAPKGVFAVGGRLGSLEIDVEDTASALLCHEVVGHALAVHVHLDFLQRPPRRVCRVVGDAGVIQIDLRQPSLSWTDREGRMVERNDFPDFQRGQLFDDEMAAFVGSARGERAVEVNLDDAMRTMRTALALRTSMETGRYQELT